MSSLCISLPVANLRVAVAFFSHLGFGFSPERSHAQGACMVIGENMGVRLVEREWFQDSVSGDSVSTGLAGDVLTGISVSSEDEVDAILARALAAGAEPWPIEGERGAYSGSFRDLDGHIWQISFRQPDTFSADLDESALNLNALVPEQAPVAAAAK